MESLLILIPVALVFVAIAIKIFFWAVKSGQFDDLETEAHRILFDDTAKKEPQAANCLDEKTCVVKNEIAEVSGGDLDGSNIKGVDMTVSDVNVLDVNASEIDGTTPKPVGSSSNERP